MSVEELMQKLRSLLRSGAITEDTIIAVRNPEVSEGAMSAGSDGYHDVEEVLVPSEERLILLGEVY